MEDPMKRLARLLRAEGDEQHQLYLESDSGSEDCAVYRTRRDVYRTIARLVDDARLGGPDRVGE